MSEWLIEDESGPTELAQASVVGAKPDEAPAELTSAIAVRLQDLVVSRPSGWLDFISGNDVRVDVLAVQGNYLESDPRSFYTPSTLRFEKVGSNQRLPTDEHGILAYYGWPKHFIDLSVMVSRDTKGSDDLATLMEKELGGSAFKGATESLLQLAIAGPAALALSGALGAAATLGGLAYRIVQKASGSTIGVYRGNRLERPHRFGLGRNPSDGTYTQQNFSFWFEVIES